MNQALAKYLFGSEVLYGSKSIKSQDAKTVAAPIKALEKKEKIKAIFWTDSEIKADIEFLQSIINACKLSQYLIKPLIDFDRDLAHFHVIFSAKASEKYQIKGQEIQADTLSIISQDKNLKLSLWNNLKTLFNL